MDVSIIIPNYNGANYIVDCIASVYDQIENKKAIIVIDNHSNDSSAALIEETFPDIILVKNDTNSGFASAVNQGIRLSRSEFIILLNNDAFARPNFVQTLYECIDSDQRIFSASSKMLSYSNPDIIDNAGDQLCILGWAFKTGGGSANHMYEANRRIFSSCAGAAIYRKKCFDQIGYFDEAFFAYLEDVDIGFRANIFGYRNVFCSKAEVLHIGSATSGSKYNDFKVRLSSRNNVYLLYKNLPLLLLVLFVPFILIGFLIKTVFFLKIGFGKPYMRGLVEGFKTVKLVKRISFQRQHVGSYLGISYMMLKSTIVLFRFVYRETR